MSTTHTRREMTPYEEDLATFDECLLAACERVERDNYRRRKDEREWLFPSGAERYAFARAE